MMKQKGGKRLEKKPRLIRSITVFIFLTSQVAALIWVTASYVIAGYATVKLGQPFPIETLSEKAIEVLLGVGALKVIENIFEHNDGGLWGRSKTNETSEETEG